MEGEILSKIKDTQVQGLLPFIPKDKFGDIQVEAPEDMFGGIKNRPLYLNRGAVKGFRLEHAYREIFQNLLDAIVEANNQSFVALEITRGIRRGNDVVTIFHNKKYIFFPRLRHCESHTRLPVYFFCEFKTNK